MRGRVGDGTNWSEIGMMRRAPSLTQSAPYSSIQSTENALCTMHTSVNLSSAARAWYCLNRSLPKWAMLHRDVPRQPSLRPPNASHAAF